MPSRVIVDASAALNQGAGIGRYARSILPRLAATMPECEFRAVVAPDPETDGAIRGAGEALLANAGISVKTLPFTRRQADILWFRGRTPLPIELFSGRGNLVYSPDFTVPPAFARRSVVTVHDLAFEVAPEFAPAGLREYLRNAVPRQVKRASRVAVVSETTRRDLIERYRTPESKIGIVSNGVGTEFFGAPPLDEKQRATLGIPESYLLMVGTLEPRKNHLGALRALELSESARELPLVIAGRHGWADDEIIRRIGELKAKGRVIWARYVAEPLLPSLYAGAAATIYPSWYEGFGLPALEALAAGSPLVISRAPVLLEVTGGVARNADAANPEAIAEAIDRAVQNDHTEAAREARIARAKQYNWDDSALAAARLLRDAVS